MKKDFVFLVIGFLFLVCFSLYAGQYSDTVWTKQLWELGEVKQIQFMSDGHHLAVGIGAGVSIFDIQTGIQTKRFNFPVFGNDNEINSFAFFDNETKLITTHVDHTMIIWDCSKVDTIKFFKNMNIRSIKQLSENTLITIGFVIPERADSIKVYIIDFNTGQILNKIAPPERVMLLSNLAINKEHNYYSIVTLGDNLEYIELYDLQTHQRIAVLGTHFCEVTNLAFSSDGRYLASSDVCEYINIWDLKTKSLVKTIRHSSQGTSYLKIKFSPKGGYLVSSGGGGKDFTTKIWDMNNFDISYLYSAPNGASDAIDISSDSNFICISNGYLLTLLNSHWQETDVNMQLDNPHMVFPNPAGTEITVPIEPNAMPKAIKILNFNGQIINLINQFNLTQNEVLIDISPISVGVFYAIVIYPSKSITYKFEIVR